ncbi:cyclic nucleotide-binding/CBS domain-containing protein [Pseudoroseicyclus sp. CXY001]|uniref:CBS domain-containing protein n=1 Tax=Pseudoroseicyclus sp. CXY001 TaxID=3242492 RepID=UPI00358DC376
MTLGDMAARRTVVTASPETSILTACKRMCDERIGAIIVLRAGNLVGIVTERDILRRVICRYRDASETTVGDVMTPGPITGEEGESPLDGLKKMRTHGIRHLPVMRRSEMLGIVSERDMPVSILAEAERRELARLPFPAERD